MALVMQMIKAEQDDEHLISEDIGHAGTYLDRVSFSVSDGFQSFAMNSLQKMAPSR